MPANWNKFKLKVESMVNDMGAETCTITIPPTSSYDFIEGDINTSDSETDTLIVALLATTKDDLDYIPEGFRTKDIRKVLSLTEITKEMKIEDSDGNTFEMVRPSIPQKAGGLTHCYRTYIARIENQ